MSASGNNEKTAQRDTLGRRMPSEYPFHLKMKIKKKPSAGTYVLGDWQGSQSRMSASGNNEKTAERDTPGRRMPSEYPFHLKMKIKKKPSARTHVLGDWQGSQSRMSASGNNEKTAERDTPGRRMPSEYPFHLKMKIKKKPSARTHVLGDRAGMPSRE